MKLPGVLCAVMVHLASDTCAAQASGYTPQTVFDQIDKMAVFEAALNRCGESTDVEDRLAVVADGCFPQAMLEEVRSYWHRRMAEESAFYADAVKGFCGSPDILRLTSDYKSYVEDLVADAARYCR